MHVYAVIVDGGVKALGAGAALVRTHNTGLSGAVIEGLGGIERAIHIDHHGVPFWSFQVGRRDA